MANLVALSSSIIMMMIIIIIIIIIVIIIITISLGWQSSREDVSIKTLVVVQPKNH